VHVYIILNLINVQVKFMCFLKGKKKQSLIEGRRLGR